MGRRFVAKLLPAKAGAWLLMLAALSAPAQGDDDKPARYRLTAVTKVTITTPSARIDMGGQATVPVPQEDCGDFAITPRKVREFFRHAQTVSHAVYTHDLEWSACYAEGKVTFANKDVGEWTISRFGKGSLLVRSSKGSSREQSVLLYCRPCGERW